MNLRLQRFLGYVCLAAVVFVTCDHRRVPAKNPAHNLVFTNIRGQPVSLRAFEGRVILINLWASWCKPCIEEFPRLSQLQSRFFAQGLTVLPVNTDVQLSPGAKVQLQETSAPLTTWFDDEGQAMNYFRPAYGFPVNILLDRQGHELWRREGVLEETDAEFEAVLATAL